MDYNEAAKTWDDDPARRERAALAAAAIARRLPAGRRGTALELGAGTGLLGFALAERFERLVLADGSPGMLERAAAKAAAAGLKHLSFRRADFGDLPADLGPANALFMHMALHHAPDFHAVLDRCRDLLAPGGLLFIADLVKEDGSFHRLHPDFRGQNGFDTEAMVSYLSSIGLKKISVEIVYSINKTVDGREREYPVFLLMAERTVSPDP